MTGRSRQRRPPPSRLPQELLLALAGSGDINPASLPFVVTIPGNLMSLMYTHDPRINFYGHNNAMSSVVEQGSFSIAKFNFLSQGSFTVTKFALYCKVHVPAHTRKYYISFMFRDDTAIYSNLLSRC